MLGVGRRRSGKFLGSRIIGCGFGIIFYNRTVFLVIFLT